MTPRRAKAQANAANVAALDRAVAREDWEAAALYALLAFARVVREMPAATLDDLLAALAREGDGDAAARS
jgi:hypothetical protein